jgi:hypothetical protein
MGLLWLAGGDIAHGKATHFELGMFPQPLLRKPEGLEPDASGRAIFNLAKGAGKTIVQMNCKGLTPDIEYTAFVFHTGRWHEVGKFVAKKNGTGTLHLDLPAEINNTVRVGVNREINGRTWTVLMSIMWKGW